jgi:tetratricopeptide (TPR) repeat protein
VLRKKEAVKSASVPPRIGSAISFLQSWKFTLITAVVLIGVVLYFSMSRKGNPHAGATLSPGEESAIQEIEVLQKRVDASPGDTTSLLRLANLLQDVRFYTRAITTYQRYLVLVPQNADAWVDAGTSFFALSFEDSTRRVEYLASARQEILKALAIAPKHQLAYFNLGIVELHSGNIDKAADAFKKCIDLDPSSDAGKKAQQFLSQHPINNLSQ